MHFFAEHWRVLMCSYVWAGASKQREPDKHVGVGGYGYPAFNMNEAAYGLLKSTSQREQIMSVFIFLFFRYSNTHISADLMTCIQIEA